MRSPSSPWSKARARSTSSPILATEIIDPAGQAPVGFELTYDPSDIDPDGVYTLQAGIFDSDRGLGHLQGRAGHHERRPAERGRHAELPAGRRQGRGHRQRHGRRDRARARRDRRHRPHRRGFGPVARRRPDLSGQAARAVRDPVRRERPAGGRHVCRPGRTDERIAGVRERRGRARSSPTGARSRASRSWSPRWRHRARRRRLPPRRHRRRRPRTIAASAAGTCSCR